MLKIVNVVGARPNFMKVAPIHYLMKNSHKINPLLVHTGQHYDEKMSKTFFIELEMPEPDLYLGVGSGTHAQQTAAVMVAMEKMLQEERPDWLLVVGDVNSTLASSIAAAKLNIPVAHVESGLRSFDRQMPEEINRILTDSIADMLFVTEQSGLDNLEKEGIPSEKVRFVGNVMIDSLVQHLQKASQENTLKDMQVEPDQYVLMTLHRPSNVDNKENFIKILNAVQTIKKDYPIIFPIHPRSKKMIDEFGLQSLVDGVKLVEPLGYLAFLNLMSKAKLVLTDSGGIQEETTYLGIPCLTIRENTERPVTVEIGTNRLVGVETKDILGAYSAIFSEVKKAQIPPLWDGKAAERIVDFFLNI